MVAVREAVQTAKAWKEMELETKMLVEAAIWVSVALLTYAYIRFSGFGRDTFRYNLSVEGESSTAIEIFSILFAVFFPLWWIFMFPIVKLIGRHDQKWLERLRKRCLKSSIVLKNGARYCDTLPEGEIARLHGEYCYNREVEFRRRKSSGYAGQIVWEHSTKCSGCPYSSEISCLLKFAMSKVKSSEHGGENMQYEQ